LGEGKALLLTAREVGCQRRKKTAHSTIRIDYIICGVTNRELEPSSFLISEGESGKSDICFVRTLGKRGQKPRGKVHLRCHAAAERSLELSNRETLIATRSTFEKKRPGTSRGKSRKSEARLHGPSRCRVKPHPTNRKTKQRRLQN